jgi:hypothetical protein
MTIEVAGIEFTHSITDDQMCEYQSLKTFAEKLLQVHRAGNLGLVKERDRLMTQLAQILDPLHADVKPPRHYLETT